MRNKWKQLLLVIAVLIFSRLAIFTVGYFVTHNFTADNWTRWDGGWYYNIMTTGYDNTLPVEDPKSPICNDGTGHCQRDIAFFPLYPVVAKGVGDVFHLDYHWSGFLVSNLCFIAAGCLLFRLAKRLFKSVSAAWWSLLCFASFPFGYVFSGVMTESMFVFLLILAYTLAFERKYFRAGLAGMLLAATRNTGILFILPLFLVWFEQENHITTKNIWHKLWNRKNLILALIIVPCGLFAFMLYLNNHVGDPLAFVHIQKYWDKPVLGLNPLFAFFYSFIDRSVESVLLMHIMDLGVVAFVVGLFIYSIKEKILKFSLNNIMLWIIVPMTAGTLLAIGRYAAVAFPIYLVLGALFTRHPKIGALFVTGSFILLLVFSRFYVLGSWITV